MSDIHFASGSSSTSSRMYPISVSRNCRSSFRSVGIGSESGADKTMEQGAKRRSRESLAPDSKESRVPGGASACWSCVTQVREIRPPSGVKESSTGPDGR